MYGQDEAKSKPTNELHEVGSVFRCREKFLGNSLELGGEVAQELIMVVHHVAQQTRVNVFRALRQRPQQLVAMYLILHTTTTTTFAIYRSLVAGPKGH